MERFERAQEGGFIRRAPGGVARAGVLCAAVVWGGACNGLLGIDLPELRDDTAAAASSSSAGGGGGQPGGDTGGGGGAGGGGGGGAPQCDVLEVLPGEDLDLSMIDDMEDGDIDIPEGDGKTPRSGAWFMFGDDTEGAILTPEDKAGLVQELPSPRPEGDGESTMAVHTSGEGFADWGAGIGVNLLGEGYYDASEYRGLTFWGRAEEGTDGEVLVAFVDQQTHDAGGICDPEVDCHDYFSLRVTLTPSWTQFKVPIECLRQGGWGREFEAVAIDRLWAIQFRFTKEQVFDVWIDDVAFYR